MDHRIDTTTLLGGPVVATTRIEGVATTRVRGVVRWFSADRGFGYLAPDDGGDDVFVSWSALPGAGFRCLDAGQLVSWLPAEDEHGPVASTVEVPVRV